MGTHISTLHSSPSTDSSTFYFSFFENPAAMQKILCVAILILAIVVDANYIRGRRALGRKKREGSSLRTDPVDMEHCRDGRKRKCSCSDGSVADLTQKVCPQDEHIDQATCACPEGFEEYKPEFRSHGLHKLCKGPGDAKKRPDCKCNNGTLADWNRHPCQGNAHLQSCTCWA